MDRYFKMLDLLFDSNYKIQGPEAMKRNMKNHLVVQRDVLDGALFIMSQWKQERLQAEDDDLKARALLLL
jgi:hypothetical protein